jgi:hypothetical protein
MNDERRIPSLDGGYARIVTRMIPSDPEGDYAELERKLRLRETAPHRAEQSAILDALDETQDCAWRAHCLYLGARVAYESFEIDARTVTSSMRDAATISLQEEKTRGTRSKQITDADVEARMAEMFPDEWRSLSLRRVEARKAVDALEQLAKLWGSRSSTLEAELRTSRSRGSSSLID